MKRGNFFGGILFIILGSIFLLNYVFNYFTFTAENTWPFYLLILGLGFELNYFLTSKRAWSLIPGGVLITTGIISLVEVMYNHWRYAEYTWPVYLLIPIAGLSQFYYFSGKKNKHLLIPIYILSSIAVISILSTLLVFSFQTRLTSIIIAAIFIIVGLLFIFKKQENKKIDS